MRRAVERRKVPAPQWARRPVRLLRSAPWGRLVLRAVLLLATAGELLRRFAAGG